MMFEQAVGLILRFEGGLSDDPKDPGGITSHGISLRFAGSVGFDADHDGDTDSADIRAMTLDDARALYRKHFWDALKCDQLPPGLALAVFDCGVNQGVGAAIRLLQRAIGVSEDGKIGPKTLERLVLIRQSDGEGNERGHEALRRFTTYRLLRYAATRNFNRFGGGWIRRTLDVFAIEISQMEKTT